MGKILLFLLFSLIPQSFGFAKIPNDLNPNIACSILQNEGFITKKYIEECVGCGEYFCASPYKIHDLNNIAFYVNGNIDNVKKINLTLNLNNLLNEKNELKTFENYCSILFKKISKNELPIDIIKSINLSKPITIKVDNLEIELEKEIFPSKKGYRLSFTIK